MNGTNSAGVDFEVGGQPFHLDLDPPEQTGAAAGGEGGQPGAAAGTQGTGESGAETPQLPENIARMISDTTSRATKAEHERDLLKRQMDDLRASQAQPFMPGTQQAQPSPQEIRAQLAKALEGRFMQNPGETLADVLLTAQHMSAQTAQGAMSGVASGQAELVINGYMQAKANDPAFSMVREAFMEKLAEARKATPPEALARATPDMITSSLDKLYKEAAGELALGNLSKRARESTPPPYSTGGSGAGGNARTFAAGAGQNGQSEMAPRNAIEQEIVNSAKSYGLKDEHILQALKAHREENA